ncbi:MAG: hypothetical protein V1790_01050 [Planctomycetota bacterium]
MLEASLMLARYKIYRGKRPPDDPLPMGIRQDTRWRTKHLLRPNEAIVKELLAEPGEQAWSRFRTAYLDLLERRFIEDRVPFDKLAELAKATDVYLGCSCPTELNPRVDHCHTFLALQFMKRRYRSLPVRLPRS